ncbi:MAG: 50S ribosomal protein L11 methyltransferase [Candidatus Pacebacteria bacterium]|nr:50S ribosomal protein L11 methyltransferase [Candidatus Paceibacterota bacterium]
MKKYTIDPKMSYKQEELWFPLALDILNWEEDFHDLMLNDQIRMIAYEKAIKEVVKPGMTVVDIGTGTGILALWALEAGARRVHGIDVNEKRIPEAIERINKAGFTRKFHISNQLSYDVELSEKVDVVISEILGNMADNEDMVPILNDARKRFLKEDGVMLPRKVESFLVPVDSSPLHEQVKNGQCKSINNTYTLKAVEDRLGTNSKFDIMYDAIVPNSSLISEPKPMQTFSFTGSDKSEYKAEREFEIKKGGMFTGFKGYFIANLSEATTLDISGDDIKGRTTSDCWKHAFLPIEKPFVVESGDILTLRFERFYPKDKTNPFKEGYAWSGEVKRDGKTIYEYSQKMG